MIKQRGQALILVLILLAVGSLTIVPILSYTYTGLRSQQISEKVIAAQYTANSALEQVLWQMLNGVMDQLIASGDSFGFEFGTITVPAIPDSRNYGTGNIHNLFYIVDPKWFRSGDNATKSYIIAVDTQNWKALTDFGFILPKGLTYTTNSSYYKGPDPRTGSYKLDLTPDGMYWNWQNQVDLVGHRLKLGTTWQPMTGGGGPGSYVEVYDGQYPPPGTPQPNTSYLLITTEPDGRQRLQWKPYFSGLSGRRVFVQTLHVTGDPGWGIHYISAWFYGAENIDIAQTAAMGVAFYTIRMTVEGVEYEVIVAYDSTTGGFVIISYQIVG